MSNVIAQSATQLSVSNHGKDWTEVEFQACVQRAAERTAKGTTRERLMLNRSKLIHSVCEDYRSHFPERFGKRDVNGVILHPLSRLPTDEFNKVEKAVDEYLNTQLHRINALNCISFRRAFHHNASQQSISERVVATGENILSLQEQKLGVTLFITTCERKLRDLQSKPTPDYDAEKECKQQLMRLNATKAFIEGEIEAQSKPGATV